MHTWTEDEEKSLKDLLAQGMTYPAVAEWFRTDGAIPEASPLSIRSKARGIGVNPAARGRTPEPIAIPRGIAGGTRFKKYEIPVRPGDRIAVLSDFQIPYHDEKTIATVERFLDDYEPNVLVLNGDVLDFYSLSMFTHNPAHPSDVQNELDIAEKLFGTWARRFPGEKVWVLGNHEDRLRKYLWEHPGFSSLRSLDMETMLSLGGAWKILPYGSQAKIGETLIVHGDAVRRKAGQSAWAMYDKLGTSLIMGHTHRLAQASHRNAHGQHTLIEGGCMCRLDPEYGPFPDWTQGFVVGYVNNGSVHWRTIPILEDGFRAGGRFYRRER